MVYVDPRTGMSFETEAIATRLGYGPGSTAPAPTNTIPVVTPSGAVFNSTYSQYWMDPNYDESKYGTPTLDQKAASSTAQYASSFAGTLATQAIQQAQNAGNQPSPAIQVVAATQAPTATGQVAATVPAITDQLTGAANAAVSWFEQNFLLVVMVVAAVIIVPNLLRAATRSRA